MALADSRLPVQGSVSTADENPEHVSPAPETFPTHDIVYPAVSANELATPSEAATGPASSILASPLETDTQPEGLSQTSPSVAWTHPVSPVEPTDSMLSPNTGGHAHEVSQQNSLDTPDQISLPTSTDYLASHNLTITLPSITSQTKYRPVLKEMKGLYLDGDAIPIRSGILQTCVKYHEKTADF
jgi:hypothetical protein